MSVTRRTLTGVLHLATCVACLTPTPSQAQSDAVTVAYMQGTVPLAPDAVATLGTDLFGDKVNLFNGSLEFEQIDVELPGNNALPVALLRQHFPGRSWFVRGALADWDLNTPRIEGTFAVPEGWIPIYGNPSNRCSGFDIPPQVSRGARTDEDSGEVHPATDFFPWEYGHGINLNVPGHGSQEILIRAAGNGLAPSDDNNYPLVTRNNWQIGCLAGLQNDSG